MTLPGGPWGAAILLRTLGVQVGPLDGSEVDDFTEPERSSALGADLESQHVGVRGPNSAMMVWLHSVLKHEPPVWPTGPVTNPPLRG